jgi:hypothetical protein
MHYVFSLCCVVIMRCLVTVSNTVDSSASMYRSSCPCWLPPISQLSTCLTGSNDIPFPRTIRKTPLPTVISLLRACQGDVYTQPLTHNSTLFWFRYFGLLGSHVAIWKLLNILTSRENAPKRFLTIVQINFQQMSVMAVFVKVKVFQTWQWEGGVLKNYPLYLVLAQKSS